jgi:repressor LexA
LFVAHRNIIIQILDVSLSYIRILGDMNRLRELREIRNLSQEEVAAAIGISRPSYANYELGHRKPRMQNLTMLASYFGVSIDYLLGIDHDQERPGSTLRIPVLGEVPAGQPIDAFEQVEEYLDLYPSFALYGELFGLRVKGHSMEPDIHNGDIVIVVKQDFIESGDIAVVRVNDTEVTVKKVKKLQDGIVLMPKNPAFEPVYFSNEQVRTLPVTIIGKVLEIRRRL